MNDPKWVAGFIFNEKLDRVLLLRKLRGPDFNINKLNGVGGKIEKSEHPLEAIRRETEEETGFQNLVWERVCDLETSSGGIIFFASKINNIDEFEQKEDEPLGVFEVDVYHKYNPANNLRWLIPMSINVLNMTESCKRFKIEEIY